MYVHRAHDIQALGSELRTNALQTTNDEVAGDACSRLKTNNLRDARPEPPRDQVSIRVPDFVDHETTLFRDRGGGKGGGGGGEGGGGGAQHPHFGTVCGGLEERGDMKPEIAPPPPPPPPSRSRTSRFLKWDAIERVAGM